jgi:hypothetical protein
MKKIGSLFFYIFIFFIILKTTAAFAEVNVSVEVNPESVGLGDQIQISLLIQSTDDLEVDEPTFPETDGLTLIHAQNSGQSSSSRMNIINGKTEFSKTVTQQYDFVVQANRTGIVTIPSFQVLANGKKITTAPQNISVGKTAQNSNPQRQLQRQRQQQIPSSPFGDDDDDMFSQLMKQRQKMIEDMQKQMGRGGARGFGGQNNNPLDQFFGAGQEPQEVQSKKLDVNEKESFFIYLDIDKKEVYEGEQVTANWYIYTRGNLESIDRAKFPDLKGFWKEIIEEVPNLQFVEEIVNGVRFKKGLLASHALFPIKAGTAVVDEFKIKGKVRLPTQFGWGQLQEYTRASRRTPIKVLPLPIEGKPQSFSGAVGQFQIQTQVEGMQFPANQPFTLKVRFEGSGNAKLIELPPIEWPAGLEVYDTKSESKFFKNGQSYKEFEILLVPKNTGELKIPQITFSYFDPEQKKYITKSTESLDLKITEGLAENKNTQTGQVSSESTKVVEKITPVLEFPGSFSWMENRLKILFSFLGFIVVLILSLYLKDSFQIQQLPQFKKIVDHKLAQIEKSLSRNEDRKVGAEVVDLIYLLLAQLAQEKKAVTEWNQMIAKVPQNYRDQYEAQLSQNFEYFQMVGFAPDEVKALAIAKASVKDSVSELKKLTSKIIADLPKT